MRATLARARHSHFASTKPQRKLSCLANAKARSATFMNKFRQLGFINYNGELEVHNSLLNVILHDAPQIRRGTPENKKPFHFEQHNLLASLLAFREREAYSRRCRQTKETVQTLCLFSRYATCLIDNIRLPLTRPFL